MKYLRKYNESHFVTDAEADELLDKILDSGIESLSDIENKRLKYFKKKELKINEYNIILILKNMKMMLKSFIKYKRVRNYENE